VEDSPTHQTVRKIQKSAEPRDIVSSPSFGVRMASAHYSTIGARGTGIARASLYKPIFFGMRLNWKEASKVNRPSA
jgi:hypothetical protein